MGLLQIDTIHVVNRSPYLVLHSRLGDYRRQWLEELLAEGKLFEWWAHALCWVPREDWPLWRGLMLHGMRERNKPWDSILDWLQKNRAAADIVLAQIRERGPQCSADFQAPPERADKRTGVWWDWREEKAALEFAFWTGELMIARRDRFQRVYELRERVVPGWDDAQALPEAEARVALIRRAALALGAATEPWLRDYYRFRYQHVARTAIQELVDTGELLECRIEAVPGQAYLHRDLLPLLQKAEGGKLVATHSALLSPFDPLVWDRKRNRELYDFDYTIEVYTPEHKRQFGYFVMPILRRGELVGRLDPKAHRKDGVFEIKALHLEASVKLDRSAWQDIARAVQASADWHGTPRVTVGTSDPPGAARSLTAALKAK